MLTDSPASITKKIRSAVTDSTHGITYEPVTRPGVTNLLTILTAFREFSQSGLKPEAPHANPAQRVQMVAAEYAGKGAGDLKKDVTEAVVEGWRRPQEELDRLRKDRGYLELVFQDGHQRACALSKVTLRKVKERIGLTDANTPVGVT